MDTSQVGKTIGKREEADRYEVAFGPGAFCEDLLPKLQILLIE